MSILVILFVFVGIIWMLVSISEVNKNTHEWHGDKRTQRALEDYGVLYNPERERSNPILWIIAVGIVVLIVLMLFARAYPNG